MKERFTEDEPEQQLLMRLTYKSRGPNAHATLKKWVVDEEHQHKSEPSSTQKKQRIVHKGGATFQIKCFVDSSVHFDGFLRTHVLRRV